MAKRLQTELMKFNQNPPCGATAELKDDDLHHWVVKLPGPSGCVYEGAIYTIHIIFPDKYPMEKPTVKFDPVLYHPNIDENGEFCFDYKASMKVTEIIQTVSSYLSNPPLERSRNPMAAHQYVENRDEFNAIVKKQISSLQ